MHCNRNRFDDLDSPRGPGTSFRVADVGHAPEFGCGLATVEKLAPIRPGLQNVGR
jgi:hypothetical protein